MSQHPFARHAATRHPGASPILRSLPEETPIAMVYHGSTHAVMMASPQDIEDFATGFTLTEGVIEDASQIEDLRIVAHEAGIEAQMWLAGDRGERLAARRRSMAGPVGCGLCGIESLSAAIRDLPQVGGVGIPEPEIAAATDALRAMQPLHDETRAVHAAGFLLPGQGIVLAREDVGRHNALDKLIGAMARQGMDASKGAIVLTSRVSVEMVQKTAMAGAGVLVAVSAPTAHALRLAEGAGLTLAALARGGGFELFCHPGRIVTA
ncbi:formate dehydrogenase accessory sulfurtransferase FdhD [Paracoccus sp. PARArs4]|uniref:formate dehydrogenase accessory sulfurtransferase FdhD n=1 Tax=Paracoccus sp. PARArs4 TaxID=2853442 RepID=UPI0024A64817|nr:formate dehydrogenase accessory sulfurtransferase FdhD [Paracoccus sp. PARArs4]